MNEHIWESFDSLWQTIHRLNHRLSELEIRLSDIQSLPTTNKDETRTPSSRCTDEFEPTRKIA